MIYILCLQLVLTKSICLVFTLLCDASILEFASDEEQFARNDKLLIVSLSSEISFPFFLSTLTIQPTIFYLKMLKALCNRPVVNSMYYTN